MVPRVRAHLLISGLVQGVFYRQSTQRVASQYSVTGWVRNLPDGRVEAVLEGGEQDVQQVIAWCRHGPPQAEVGDVAVEWRPASGEDSRFAVR